MSIFPLFVKFVIVILVSTHKFACINSY